MLDEEWKSLGFAVSGEATDGEFVRRATLDIIGRIPSLAETESFLKDRSPDRREKLVNRLLASPEYGKNCATVWTHLMIPDGRDAGNMQDVNPEALRGWLASAALAPEHPSAHRQQRRFLRRPSASVRYLHGARDGSTLRFPARLSGRISGNGTPPRARRLPTSVRRVR